jgi:hypothetical protein
MSEGDQFKDPVWRLHNLYWITDKAGKVVRFRPNAEQAEFLENLHYRNIILKARQLGFSTLIQLVELDAVVFNSNIRAGVIAHTLDDVGVIFRDKIKFAYDRLPEGIRAERHPVKDSVTELLLSNNSSVRVGTSMRSGTLQYLHISEMGKIAARFPERAREIVTGAIPALAPDGFLFVEATAEGSEGAFFNMCQEARKRTGRPLLPIEEKFHFFPWFSRGEYEVDPARVVISEREHAYFDRIEGETGAALDGRKRAWYVLTEQTLALASDGKRQTDMKREYPSTPDEAFQVSVEGAYYATEMAAARKQGRILQIPLAAAPVNTFWDIGNSDGCAIWLHQQVGLEDRFIGYYEAHGESLSHYVRWLQGTGHVWGRHFLPHDAGHERLSDTNKSIGRMLEELGLKNTVIVPRVHNITAGIQMVRNNLPGCWFDQSGCKEGIVRLDNYRKRWNARDGRWSSEPAHDASSEGADAFRQFAQAREAGLLARTALRRESWRDRIRARGRGSAQAA